jgi:hypothetical protein
MFLAVDNYYVFKTVFEKRMVRACMRTVEQTAICFWFKWKLIYKNVSCFYKNCDFNYLLQFCHQHLPSCLAQVENQYYNWTWFGWWRSDISKTGSFTHCLDSYTSWNVKRPKNLRRPQGVVVNGAKFPVRFESILAK